MMSNTRTRQTTALWLVIAIAATVILGCAVNEKDLRRWETTLEGPKRLSAVVLHDKYPLKLRVEAAVSLIRMKPRKGQRVGIKRLVRGTLACDASFAEKTTEPCARHSLAPEARDKILKDLVAVIVEELKKEAPKPTQKGQSPADPSYPYKDAAYMILTYERAQIISDPALKKQLTDALSAWAMADFERKLNDRSQMYGMEQLLRFIGPQAVVGLPPLMTKDTPNLRKMSQLVAKLGDKKTKEEASKQLVEIIKYVASDKWKKATTPKLKAANEKAGFSPNEKQFTKQLNDYQNESMVRVFASMKQVGGKAVVDYCLTLAANSKQPPARRQTALAALEGHIDRKSEKNIKRLFDIAKGKNTPPVVIDRAAQVRVAQVAFRRIKEMPRDKVKNGLYAFFEIENWKIRRLAGATILAMSTVKHIDEFLDQLDKKATKNFNLAEAVTYGAHLGGLKEGSPLEKLKPRMAKGKAQSRLSALGYWYDFGIKKDMDQLKPFLEDKQKVPKCESDGGCDWICIIGKGKAQKKMEIKTVGDYVQYCLAPKVEATEEKKDDKKGKKGKKAPKPTDKKDEKGEKKDEKGGG